MSGLPLAELIFAMQRYQEKPQYPHQGLEVDQGLVRHEREHLE
ncbi:hypothetical protein KAM338_49210 [Aeromonas caviae]|nr:hypothetical protein KAM338_49210 [Aeromonas caviae]